MGKRSNSQVAFVIMFHARSGSTYLVEALERHPDVRCEYEVMAARREKGYGPKEQLTFAGNLLGRTPGRVKAVGSKTKLGDVLNRDGFASLLRERDAKILHLQRHNVVKLVVSLFNAERVHERTGDWNAYNAADLAKMPFTIDPGDFRVRLEQAVRRRYELRDFVQSLALPTTHLFYEDLLMDRSAFLERTFRFIGVEPIEVTGRTLKSTRDDLRLMLLNFDELRASYAVTEYAEMFDEAVAA
jgi:LPS sulfotransferase NodH